MKEVGTDGVKETPPVAALMMAISALAPSLTAPTEGTMGCPPKEPSTATVGLAMTLLPAVPIPMLTPVIKSSRKCENKGRPHIKMELPPEGTNNTHVKLSNVPSNYKRRLTLTAATSPGLTGHPR